MRTNVRIAGVALLLLCMVLPGCTHSKVKPSGPAVLAPEDDGLTLGNPSGAAEREDQPENYLVERPQFALSYNEARGGPNWVSWHLEQADMGQAEREDDFRPDPMLPEEWQIRPTDYQGSGFDRGHLCPSADRTRRQADNRATFVMSNMLPQTADLNREVWRYLEEYCRELTERGNELYIVTGGYGTKTRIAKGKVTVPRSCWKLIVVLPEGENDLQRINENTRVIAVDIPNDSGIDRSSWQQHVTTVDDIEEKTGLDLLSNVPVEIQGILEAKKDSSSRPRRSGREKRSRG